ncbi:MAG: cell division protein FtsZ [Deltaproteobacteria bacterium]|nr:cell division protein FtsZ [Deltaproteobacteria bacterium]MDH3773863.1 cell division protein FtsZ [Deltaproteobacteria bacterium]MDH3801115.1 cell division protein FtsZ [Deltaproteobacteria bacterium]MDH3851360.1 cell division protein FtsZ [Deltaproteobacteria bacterium]MDH3897660.1 cell division protein FtsZ [Deltaproteobacteria bacterium]
MMFEFVESDNGATIKVIGIGGGGGNAINNMINASLRGVDFIVANTDAQALEVSKAHTKLQLGVNITKGLGAGANPEIGRSAALEDADKIRQALDGTDMVFLTAGLGGGTGTGGAPVVAQIAKEIGALTVAVVTKPFNFEGRQRMKTADKGIKELKETVDTIITIPNNRLLSLAAKKATFLEMLKKADDVLLYAVKGISDLITVPGLINLDFADVKTIMSEMGMALMGTGMSSGEDRATEAAQKAISSPLLEDVSIGGAKGVLMNISSGLDLTIDEVQEASSLIQKEAHEDANIIWGTVLDQSAGDELRVTVIATGIGEVDVRPKPDLGVIRGSRHDDDLEIPTFLRRNRKIEDNATEHSRPMSYKDLPIDEEELEIPTFLRRQAD